MRGEPDPELPLFRVGRRRNHRGILHVPGVVAADHRHPPSLPRERRRDRGSIASSCRSAQAGSLCEGEVLPRGSGLVVDGPGVAGQLITRPIARWGKILAHRSDIAGAPGILDGRQVLAAHGFEGRLHKRPGIRFLSDSPYAYQGQQKTDTEHPQSTVHISSFLQTDDGWRSARSEPSQRTAGWPVRRDFD